MRNAILIPEKNIFHKVNSHITHDKYPKSFLFDSCTKTMQNSKVYNTNQTTRQLFTHPIKLKTTIQNLFQTHHLRTSHPRQSSRITFSNPLPSKGHAARTTGRLRSQREKPNDRKHFSFIKRDIIMQLK